MANGYDGEIRCDGVAVLERRFIVSSKAPASFCKAGSPTFGEIFRVRSSGSWFPISSTS